MPIRLTFEERQNQYKQREKERHNEVIKEQEQKTSEWFRPSISSKSAQIIQEQRPQVLLETVVMQSQRLAVRDAAALQERRRQKVAELYGAMSFVPAIDPLSRALGRSTSLEDLVHNPRGGEIKERIRRKVEEAETKECTFHPQINELSKQLLQPNDDELFLRKYSSEYAQVGWAQQRQQQGISCPLDGIDDSHVAISNSIRDSVYRSQSGRINMQEPERMARDIRIHILEKEEKRRSELIAREIEDLRECTFRPAIAHSLASLEKQRQDSDPVVIRGLGRYLELKHLSARQKEEALQREREVFSVKNIDQYRRAEDGSTVVQVRLVMH